MSSVLLSQQPPTAKEGRPSRKKRFIQWISLFLVLLSVGGIGIFTVVNQHKSALAYLSSSYQWKQLPIGGGGWLTGIVAQPTTPGLVYARADVGGLYKWSEQTQSWSQLFVAGAVPNLSSTDYNVESVAVSKTDPQLVYAAVGLTYSLTDAPAGRILKSTNQGKTWTDSGQRWQINGNGDNRQESERLAVDPNNENVVYFGSRFAGLWRSTDGAKTWSQISTSQVPSVTPNDTNAAGIKSVLFDASSGTVNGLTKRIYATVAGVGVYVSNDAGNSWQNIYQTTQVIVAADVASNGNAYFSIGDGHVQRYNPADNTFKDVTPATGNNYFTINANPFNPQELISGASPVTNGHLWHSLDGGNTWTALNVTLQSKNIPWMTNSDENNWLSVGNIIFDPQVSGRIWFSEGIGVFRIDNVTSPNTTLNSISNGIEEMVSTDIIAPPGGQPINTNWDRQGFYHANLTQYPQNELVNNKFSSGWDLDYSGQNPQFIVADISDHRYLNPNYSGYSTDGGKTFTTFSDPGTFNDRFAGNIAVSATNTNTIVTLPTFGRSPYVTTDRGAHWTKLDFFDGVGALHSAYYLSALHVLASDKVDGSFYIYSASGNFYRSADGQNWEKAPNAPQGSANAWVVSQVHAAPGFVGNVWASTGLGGLSYTTDKGNTWTKINGIQEARSFGFGAKLPGASYPAIYLYGQMNNQWGIWLSGDKGATWQKLADYPLNIYDNVNVVNGDMNIPYRVYVGFGGNGFAYGDMSGQGGSGTPTPAPTSTSGTQPTPAPTSTLVPQPTNTPIVTPTATTTPVTGGNPPKNNVGVSSNGHAADADYDGDGYSYSAQALKKAGLLPGKAVTLDGVSFPWHDEPIGQADNYQIITQNGGGIVNSTQGSNSPPLQENAGNEQSLTLTVTPVNNATTVAVLGSSTNGPSTVSITLTYTDGTKQTGTLEFPDWTLNAGSAPVPSNKSTLIVMPYRNSSNAKSGREIVKTYLFSSEIALQAGKTIASVTLQSTTSQGLLHVFAVGTK